MFMTMKLPDGREVAWTDGKLSGDELAIYALSVIREGDELLTPEGPRLRYADWPTEPYAFDLAVRKLFPGASVSATDVPPVPCGPEG